MHLSPVVDQTALYALRPRLAWGFLALEQPASDLISSLHHFVFRWTQSRPPPALSAWQCRLLQQWRCHLDNSKYLVLDPVMETLTRSLKIEGEANLEQWFSALLFDLARFQITTDDIKPKLRESWQRLSLGVQNLRQSPGPFSSEGESALRAFLQCLQQLQSYFQSSNISHLEEASWRWNLAVEEWEQVANLCLTGLQPATAAIQWGRLADALPLDAELAYQVQQYLLHWFQGWSYDFVYTLAPYQGQLQSLDTIIETMGLALLRWQKLLPGWQQEVAPQWADFQAVLPSDCPQWSETGSAFRWLEPKGQITQSFVRQNPWRRWLRQATYGPPVATSKEEGGHLLRHLRISRLLCTLIQPQYELQQLGFSENQWVHETGQCLRNWLEGHDPLEQTAVQWLTSHLEQLEEVLLRDFPVLERTSGSKLI